MKSITVVGLGAGEIEQMSVGVYRRLLKADNVWVRTKDHPLFDELEEVTFTSFDEVYEESELFEETYETIAHRLEKEAEKGPVLYAVPGHPLVAEQTVQLLIEKEREGTIDLVIIGGESFLDAVFTALRIDPVEGFQLVDAFTMTKESLQVTQHVLITQVFDEMSASEAKLTLMERYDAEHPVTILFGAGTKEEQLVQCPLYELDRKMTFSNLATIYVPPIEHFEQRLGDWETLAYIVRRLRAKDGCPWDQKQTHLSLRPYLIEEAHEAVQAITEEDDAAIVDELGDVLLQVFLHGQIGEESGYFDLREIVAAVSSKMIRRHPHVFGDVEGLTEEELSEQWQQIKELERGEQQASMLDEQYIATSSLLTAYNYQKEAAKVGFDWPTIRGAFQKFEEEWREFQYEVVHGTKERQLDELGDVFFTLVNIARYLKISPEQALVHANEKFYRRFHGIEKKVLQEKRQMTDYTLEELDQFWQQVKEEE